ncbi:hypothetical protein Bca52824_093077 [Brassica carinata]|uniref:Uncharacterized protein n=1 Tax=Brassica carinata TaxID=52824 RepID=A0A8X7P6X2_BRACI|nr:hypothetical protein Bca52824_093077 [Brassica carinata]
MARVSVLLCLVLLVTLGVVVSFSFAHETETALQNQESSKTATTLDHKSKHKVQGGQQVTGDQNTGSAVDKAGIMDEKKEHDHSTAETTKMDAKVTVRSGPYLSFTLSFLPRS